jgi:hypothetical protein
VILSTFNRDMIVYTGPTTVARIACEKKTSSSDIVESIDRFEPEIIRLRFGDAVFLVQLIIPLLYMTHG